MKRLWSIILLLTVLSATVIAAGERLDASTLTAEEKEALIAAADAKGVGAEAKAELERTANETRNTVLAQDQRLRTPGRIEFDVGDEPIEPSLLETFLRERATDGDRKLVNEEDERMLRDPATRVASNAMIRGFESKQEESTRNAIRILAENDAEKFLVVLNASCDLSNIPNASIKRDIQTEEYRFMVLLMPRVMLSSLLENECVYKFADSDNQEAFIKYAKRVLGEEMKAKMKELNLQGSSNDVTSYQEVVGIINDDWDKAKGAHSPLQNYVTPKAPAVTRMAASDKPRALYEQAHEWVWISDNTLWGKPEYWLKPEEFLTKTTNAEKNPSKGIAASDCSEQANTLVSLLRAKGVSAKDVRVAIGIVKFEEGGSGGHAWTELRMNDTWVVLDATVGPYYDETTGEVVDREGLPYDYWQNHEFPILEVWAYYNDEYFLDMKDKKAPKSWKEGAGTTFEKELRDGMKWSLWERILLFLLKIVGKFA